MKLFILALLISFSPAHATVVEFAAQSNKSQQFSALSQHTQPFAATFKPLRSPEAQEHLLQGELLALCAIGLVCLMSRGRKRRF